MDLVTTTLAAIDWKDVLEALSRHARTPMGLTASLAMTPLASRAAIEETYDLLDEVLAIEGAGAWVPVGEVRDVGDAVGRTTKGMVLDLATLRDVGHTLVALQDLATFLRHYEADAPRLSALSDGIQLDAGTVSQFEHAFDETGGLSSRTWPVLGELRERIAQLHASIRRTLDELVRGDTLGDILQDRFVTQRNDRYVLPIKVHARRWDLGIVHGTSSSGQTAFIEPHQVIALNNQLKVVEAQLEATERQIMAQLSAMVGRIGGAVRQALDVALTVDLVCARAGLAQQLEAIRPRVGEAGVIALRAARHPVLQLRGVDVVPNDLALTSDEPVLVLTGPNTGGKTVALKTIGLCAQLVRIGCFVPAAEGSRVDRFSHVRALIGDAQTIHEDLSSFSGHVAALSTMLEESRPGSLVLVDEIGAGTDPSEGAALGQAVLEALLARGARVVVTTHYARLKTLGELDARFATAAMQYEDGEPTYRVVHGRSGESRALAVAERSGLPSTVIHRARTLQDSAEVSLSEALASLERERQRARDAEERAAALTRELEAQRDRLEEREQAIEERAEEMEVERAQAFMDRLDKAERAIGAVVAELQRAPHPRKVSAAKASLRALRELVPTTPAPEAPAEPMGLAEGDAVRLLRLGKVGQVVSVSDQVVLVRAGSVTVRARHSEVELVAPADDRPVPATVAMPASRGLPATLARTPAPPADEGPRLRTRPTVPTPPAAAPRPSATPGPVTRRGALPPPSARTPIPAARPTPSASPMRFVSPEPSVAKPTPAPAAEVRPPTPTAAARSVGNPAPAAPARNRATDAPAARRAQRPSPSLSETAERLRSALRMPGNTLDMRGMRVDEGLLVAEQFLDRALLQGMDVVFLLHGHGTGALKQALRRWLPASSHVSAWSPAASDQGGDAYTVAALNR